MAEKRILVIGDTHIPDRAPAVPRTALGFIEGNGPWDIVVFTGDLTGEEVLRWLRGLGGELYVVRGNMDYLPLPRHRVFVSEGLAMGVHHGDGVYPRGDIGGLTRIAERLGVNVLYTGHTHRPFIAFSRDRRVLHVNPGSLTGSWGGGDYLDKPCLAMVLQEDGCLDVSVYCLGDRGLDPISRGRYCLAGGRWVLRGSS